MGPLGYVYPNMVQGDSGMHTAAKQGAVRMTISSTFRLCYNQISRDRGEGGGAGGSALGGSALGGGALACVGLLTLEARAAALAAAL